MSSAGDDDTDVMFEIGVMESPETSSRIAELAKAVMSSQDSMRQGVEQIGLSAKSVSAALAPMRSEIQAFRKEAQSLFADVQSQSLKAASVAVRPVAPVASRPQRDPVRDVDSDRPKPRDNESDLAKELANEVKTSFASLSSGAKSLRDDASEMLRDVSRAFEQVSSEAEKLKVRPTTEAKEPIDARPAREWPMPVAVPPIGSSPATKPSRPALVDIPSNIEGVMKKLGDDLREETDSIVNAFEAKVAALPNSVADVNARIKAEFDKRVKDQASAFDSMAKDLDEAVEKQRDATEQMNSAVVKGAKAAIGAARGFAELGLVSEESSEQLLRGLVAVQGVVDILDGSVDMLEAFSQGWKSVRQSVKAASDVQKAQQALSAAQLPQLRAYQASLMAEASAANIAAAANVRLGAARKGASLGIGGVASQAVGGIASQAVGSVVPKAVGSAVGGAATSAVGGAAGAGAMSIAGVGVGILGTIAAAGAALASVSLVAVELKESLTGQATAQGSLTNKIAEYEASILAGGLRMTGMFERFDSPALKFLQNVGSMGDKIVSTIPGLERFKDQINLTGGLLGDLAGLAASTAGVERAQKSLAKNRIVNDAGRERESLREEFADRSARENFSLKSETSRLKTDDFGPAMAKAQGEQSLSSDRLEQLMKALQRSNDPLAGVRVDAEQARIVRTQQRINNVGTRSTDNQIATERDLQADVRMQLAKSTQRVEGIKSGTIVADDGAAKKAGETALYWRNQLGNSIQKEMELIRSKNQLEIAGQQRVGELLKGQLDLKRQQLQASQDEQKSSMLNFARLSNVDKVKAKDALATARTKGADSLSDEQKDLLRSVGTKEALGFADRGDMAEAKRFGFGEQNFGRGFEKEQQQLQADAKRLEAQVSSTYDVRVKLEADTRGLVADLVAKTRNLLSENNKVVQEQLARELQASELKMSNRQNDQLKQLKK